MSVCRLIFDILTSKNQLKIPLDHPFDYQFLMDRLRGYAAPRDKVTSLLRSGEIIRVKKGLYIAGQAGAKAQVDPLVLAGLIYGPSYVSLETALARHGLIPERVEEIASMSVKRARSFETPLGRYRYRQIPERAFAEGITLEQGPGGGYLLATPEKALCDRVAQEKNLKTTADVEDLIFGSLRLEPDLLERLSRSRIEDILSVYQRSQMNLLGKWMEETNPGKRP